MLSILRKRYARPFAVLTLQGRGWQRLNYGRESFHPHNILISVLGASLLWVGWMGFNGCALFTILRPFPRPSTLCTYSPLSLSCEPRCSGIVWLLFFYFVCEISLWLLNFVGNVCIDL